jgi:diguanylate cyclase (GGDEF)-like protein
MKIDRTNGQQVLTTRAFGLSKSSPVFILLPLILGAGLCVLIWALTFQKIHSDRKAVEVDAYKEAASLSDAYYYQLYYTIGQIDQITLDLKYDWERFKGKVDLHDQMKKGLYPLSSQLYVTIADRRGNVLTSTINSPYSSIAGNDFFEIHKRNQASGLYISKRSFDPHSGKKVIQFSRRLEEQDGSFGGVVIVAVEPDYLRTFNEEKRLRTHDFISIRYTDGSLLVTEKGDSIRGKGQDFLHPPSFDAADGIKYIPKEYFKDGQGHYFAWHKIGKYPLYAYAALAEHDLFALHEQTAENYKIYAAAASMLTVILSIIGAYVLQRRVKNQRQVEQDRYSFQLAIDGAKEGFYTIRAIYNAKRQVIDFETINCNEYGAKIFGFSRDLIIGKRFSKLYSHHAFEKIFRVFDAAMKAGFYEDEIRIGGENAETPKWLYRRLIRYGGDIAMTVRDISEAKSHEHSLMEMANKDILTSLPNRHWLIHFLPSAIQKAATENKTLAILFIDLDNFKSINDSLGHAAGDEVLKIVAIRLRNLLRTQDHIIRLGGDEFTVVLNTIASTDEVRYIALRINQALSDPIQVAGRKNHLGASLGISLFPRDGQDAETLLKNADIAMYAAKTAGKGKFSFFNNDLYNRMQFRHNTQQELVRAIQEDQFILHYQPRINAQTSELSGMEALVRWSHPHRGIVSPIEFIAVAEESGIIVDLGALVMHKACAQIAQWQSEGLPIVPVSVNVSAQQFNNGGVTQLILACLKQYEIEPRWLEIEVTESVMLGDLDAVSREMAEISDLGVAIHMDDFGSGYSSLSLLNKIKVDKLKIDRAFAAQLTTENKGKIFFQAIISIANSLNIRVIAEGVETIEQLQVLQSLHCDEIQGYLISRPVPATEIPAILEKRRLMPNSPAAKLRLAGTDQP